MTHWGLLTGIVPTLLTVAALLGGAFLLARRSRRWWWAVVPAIVAGSAALAWGGSVLVWSVLHLVTDPLPTAVIVWAAVILAAVGLAVASISAGSWRRRVVAVAAALVVVAAAGNGINKVYGYYPALGDVAGVTSVRQLAALPPIGTPVARAATRPAGWSGVPAAGTAARSTIAAAPSRTPAPAGTALPAGGAVVRVSIPGVASRFATHPGWVYLPPAYLADTSSRPPVLVLIPGDVSTTKDWIVAGHVVGAMDEFAAKHHGMAPIVVMPDAIGASSGRQLCVNSRLGNVDTYLAVDVPAWARTHLRADPDTAHWAIGGFSYGGTCAVTLAVAHPNLYPTFLDISGQAAPTLGTARYTAGAAFGSDLAAYRAVQPLEILATHRGSPAWQKLDGTFAVGAGDSEYGPIRARVEAACKNAGMTTRSVTVPGGHSWQTAAAALVDALPHLTQRMGIQ